jgi:serine/threonine-protein kinase
VVHAGVVNLEPGDSFDRYEIEHVIGQGGMGVVYRAHDPKLHRSVALKILAPKIHEPDSSFESEGAARLLREARAAAALDHPNAVSIFDVGEVGGTPFIAMELVEGQTLRAKIGDVSATLAQKIDWLVDVAKALQAAHERGLVHRDVKPENVMVRRDGVAKVLDFGIARRAHSEHPPPSSDRMSVPTITGEGVVVGTPLYMAPEQLHGERLDGRADQFAWGTMAYELLSGKLPWGSLDDGIKIVAALVSKDPPPLDSVAPVSEKVARVVHRALAKNPSARFPSMRAVASALEAAAGLSGSDAALAMTELATPTVKRRRRSWLVLAATVLGIGAISFGAWRESRKVETAPSSSASGTAPIACKEFPQPDSKNAEALAAYRSAMQAFCDGNDPASLLRATLEKDPAMAAPHVYLGGALFSTGRVDDARHEVQTALQSRTVLASRDADYLSWLEPVVMRTPPDWKEAIHRLDDILAKTPFDPVFWFARSWANLSVNDTARARADAERAFALDPHFAFPQWCIAMAYHQEGKLAEEGEALDRCTKAAPGSRLCVVSRGVVHAKRGDCVAMAADGDQLIAMSPDDAIGYRLRNNALAHGGAEIETLRAGMAQLLPKIDPKLRDDARLSGMVLVAAWSGDFVEAEAAARARQKTVPESDLKLQSAVAWQLVQALVESDRLADAGAAAKAYLEKSDLLTLSVVDGVHGDMTPALLEVARRSGAISPERAAARHDAWIAKWTKMFPGKDDVRSVRIAAEVLPVESREDGESAARQLPDLLPLTAEWDLDADAMLGKLWYHAGHWSEAIPHLEKAADTCFALEMPFATTRSTFLLGEALAATGDKPKACQAHAAVMARWRDAKPKSVTAEAAKKAFAKLGCSR